MLIRNKFLFIIVFTSLLGITLPPSYSNPNFDKESDFLNNVNSPINENNLDTYISKDKLDEYIIRGATYSTKFVPLMNDGAEGGEYTNLMINDGKRLLVDA